MEREIEAKKPPLTAAPPRLATAPAASGNRPARSYGLRFDVATAQKPDPVTATPQAPVGRSVMDIVTPKPAPPRDTDEATPSQPSPLAIAAPVQPPPKPAKLPRQKGSGIGLAIFATIIIVFGLAGLAVYAYLQTN